MRTVYREAGKTHWNLSDKSHWTLIAIEIVLTYSIFFISASQNWPSHIYLRFLMIIPAYHSGSVFGYSGNIVTSLLTVFLFVPFIPIISNSNTYKSNSSSPYFLLGFMILFGIVVSGTVGVTRKTSRYVDKLSKVFMNILGEPDEISIIRRSCFEAEALLEAEKGVILARRDGETKPENWILSTATSSEDHNSPAMGLAPDNILVWSASRNRAMATNSVETDERIAINENAGHVKSAMSIPISFEESVYGAILLMNKKNGDNFSTMDLSIAKAIAETAGSAIHSVVNEKKRQSEKLLEEQMRALFSKYVSSSVADYVLERPDLLEGRWQEVTVLITDIRDFTAMSEKVSPRALVSQLNEYLTGMVDVIFANQGTIDKFIGDCIIAYWGAPAPDPEHAAHAIQAAKSMRDALDSLNASWEERGMRRLEAGISVHTCKVLIGNIGDERKKAFTIMGEEIDNALTYEKLTKQLGQKIIISESAATAAGAREDIREIPPGSGVSGRLFSLNMEMS